jgi:membrane-bound lytic murein transglycosylase D
MTGLWQFLTTEALKVKLAVLVAMPAPNFGLDSTKIDIETRLPATVTVSDPLIDKVFDNIDVSMPLAAEMTEPSSVKPMSKEQILNDEGNRIANEFAVPKGLEERTSFWFDVYTKYSEKQHIVHHVLYPWIVYRVIDTSAIDNTNLHRWTKYHKAKQYVRAETQKVRKALNSLAARKTYTKMSAIEREIFNALKDVKGNRRKVMREAAQNMRVQLGQRDFFLGGFESSAKYLPYMEQEFIAAGVPVELTRLPFVESSFNEKAHSKVGASGIWQIMPATGRAYFKVNEVIDERNSPLKASVVAIDIFRSNYKQLKQWPLAVTAYNHGAGGVKKALKISRTQDLPSLIDKYHEGSFKFASANFYTCFLAALHAERYHREVFSAAELAKALPMAHHVFALGKQMRVKNLIKLSGLSKEKFLTYNMDLKNAAAKNAVVPAGFKILLPPEAKASLEQRLISNPNLMKEAANISIGKKRRG